MPIPPDAMPPEGRPSENVLPTFISDDWKGLAPPPAVPPSAGRFRLLGEIARGGMGIVYSALDPQFGREVAVKVLGEQLGDLPETIRRFDEESRITGQLQHPGIPAAFEIGRIDDGRPFLAMKLVKGRTLARLIEDGGPGRPDLVSAFEQICQAVAYAHSHHVIHRDLKPANVMVGTFGEVQVMDWGLAKVLGERREAGPASSDGAGEGTEIKDPRSDTGGSETQTGHVLGTLAYMPPEQAAGAIDLIDERADVFGLGAILCVILTGKPPYLGTDGDAVRWLAVRGKLDECHARLEASGSDPELVALARRCLSPEIADRPRNAGEVAATVAELRRRADERARRAEVERARTELRVAEERKRRHVQRALATSVVGFLLLAGTAGWWVQKQQEERRFREQAREDQDRRVKEGVERTLAGAPDLYRRALWGEVESALEQATALLGAGGDAELRARVGAAEKELEFLKELDAIRLAKFDSMSGRFTPGASAAEKYDRAFRKNGFDVEKTDDEALAAGIGASPIRPYLLAAMDDWATLSGGRRKRLFGLTAKITGQGWRTELAEVWENGPRLAKLYDAVPPEQRSSAFIVSVGMQLQLCGQDGARRLEDGLRRYPKDVWIHAQLGSLGGAEQADRRVGAWRSALAIRPDTATFYLGLGSGLAAKGDLEAAVAAHEESIRLAPRYAFARIALGSTLKDKGEIDASIREYREAVRLDPKNFMAHSGLGRALQQKGDFDGAAECYRTAIPLAPAFTRSLHGEAQLRLVRQMVASLHGDLSKVLAAKKDPEGELAELIAATRAAPEHALSRSSLAFARMQRGDTAGAIGDYREALRLDPTSGHQHANLGWVLARTADHAGAVRCYRDAIRLAPKNVFAHSGLGDSLFATRDFAGAIAAFNAAIRHDPKYFSAYTGLGNVLYAARDFEGAAGAFEQAVRLDPKSAYYHSRLGDARRAKGEFDKAIPAYEGAVRLDPKLTSGYFGLGAALHGKRDLRKALAAYEGANRANPKDHFVLNNLGLVRYDLKDFDGAIVAFRAAIRHEPKLVFAHNGLGNALKAKGDLAGAVASFKEAIRIDPNYAFAHENVGLIAMQQGRWREALEALDKAHSLLPENGPIRSNRTLVQRRLVLAQRLPAVARGTDAPFTPLEGIEFAVLAAFEFNNDLALSYRLFVAAFAGDAKLLETYRYYAACVALRFAAGDDPKEKPPGRQRGSLRKQAAEWLNADLASVGGLAASAKPADRQRAALALRQWIRNTDFASVRDPKRLEVLLPEERRRWEAFWVEVSAALAKATAEGGEGR